ncbi:GIY-YIG nuclease family protein [bacterium]|nr:GIY-YIG nuclease family protein [bacterium]
MVLTTDGYYYTGISTDPERRFREHCRSGRNAARFFRAHPPEALVFTQKIGSRSLASKVEYRLKEASRMEKQQIATGGALHYDRATGRLLRRRTRGRQ